MKNRAIDLQIIKPVKPGTSGSKGKIFLKQLLKEELQDLGVPVNDPCCSTEPPVATNWLLAGNENTIPGTDFLGTTDANDFVIKTNNVERARVKSSGNVGIGLNNPTFKLEVGGTSSVSDRKIGINGFQVAYMPDQTPFLNSFFLGQDSGTNISHVGGLDSWNLVGIGVRALKNNTTGYNNTAVGVIALELNTTGYYGTAVGTGALSKNTTGVENTAVGMNALTSNINGSYNTALGTSALLNNTSGDTNTAVGNLAMRANTTGLQNVALGYRCLENNTTGFFNTTAGYRCMETNTTGAANAAFGEHALSVCSTANFNTAVGMYAGNAFTGTGDSYNTFIGYASGGGIGAGVRNTIIGATVNVPSGVNDSIYIGNGAGNVRLSFNSTGIAKLGVVPPDHADNAAAILAGLTVGEIYRTGDILKVVN